MKLIALIALSVFATSAFASVRIVCTGENQAKEARKMVLTQVGSTKMVELARYNFVLEVFKAPSRAISTKEIVTVSFEDVQVNINNRAKRIEGKVFMDEADGAWITIGNEEIMLVCPSVNL